MATSGTTGPERRRGGRAARASDRAIAAALHVVQPRRRIPTYALLDAAALERLEAPARSSSDAPGVGLRCGAEALAGRS